MRGLLKKDIFLILKSFSPIYLILFFAVMIQTFQSPRMIFPMITFWFTIFFSSQTITTMTFDEDINWNQTMHSIPITIYDEVASKYLISMLMGLLSYALILFIGCIFIYIIPFDITSLREVIWYSIISFCLCILYNSIMIPIAFRYGTRQSRIILLICVAAVPSLILLILNALGIIIPPSSFSSMQFAITYISIIVMIILISYSFCIILKNDNKL